MFSVKSPDLSKDLHPGDVVDFKIDAEIARLWKARGIYPGLGSALSSFGLDHGALLAHEIVRAGAESGTMFDAFAFIDSFVAEPERFPQGERLGFGASFREKWKGLPAQRRRLLELVGRCNLQPEQALRTYQPSVRSFAPPISDIDIANPYLIFERDEAAADRIGFAVVDRGVFPGEAVCRRLWTTEISRWRPAREV